MKELKITLPFCPSSNTAYPTDRRTGRRFKSKKLSQWLKDAPTLSGSFCGECRITYNIYFPDNRKRDGQNYLKVVLDYLVSQGVIEDDNRFIVRGEEWNDCGNDKENPRIEVILKVR